MNGKVKQFVEGNVYDIGILGCYDIEILKCFYLNCNGLESKGLKAVPFTLAVASMR
jgi:hypothetical protein